MKCVRASSMLCMCIYLIPLDGQILFHCLHVPRCLSIHCWWTVGLFPLLAIKNTAAIHICVQVFIWTSVFHSLGYVSRSGITGSDGTAKLLFTVDAPFYSYANNVWRLPFLCVYTNTYLFPVLKKITAILVGVKCCFIVVLICIFPTD